MEQRQDRAVGRVSNRAAKRRLRWLRNGTAPRDGSSISRAVDICSAGIRGWDSAAPFAARPVGGRRTATGSA